MLKIWGFFTSSPLVLGWLSNSWYFPFSFSFQPTSAQHISTVTIPKPVMCTHNISFPTSTSQLGRNGHRYDPWKTGGYSFQKSVSPGSTASPASGYMYSCSSNSSPASLGVSLFFYNYCSFKERTLVMPKNFVSITWHYKSLAKVYQIVYPTVHGGKIPSFQM